MTATTQGNPMQITIAHRQMSIVVTTFVTVFAINTAHAQVANVAPAASSGIVLSGRSDANVATKRVVNTVEDSKRRILGGQATDLALADGNVLNGRMVTAEGKPVPNAKIRLLGAFNVVAETRSDANGAFRFDSLRTGAFAMDVNGVSVQSVRLWSPGAAPPKARPALLLVQGSVTRAQACSAGAACDGCDSCAGIGPQHTGLFDGFFQGLLHNPWLIGAGTAAAIAVPLATNDDDESGSGTETTVVDASDAS